MTCALLGLAASAVTVSSTSAATTGGGGLGGAGTPTGTPTPVPATGTATVSASGTGLTLQTRSSAMLRSTLSFSGTTSQPAGTQIEIERSGRETGWIWAPTTTATVAQGGTFTATWATDHIGRFAIRAVALSSIGQPEAVTGPLTSTVFLQTKATLYGPGLYGRKTACGERLTPQTVGVANRTLKCGESVALSYDGRTINVPVIDHGPYANGADWDLTEATGSELGMDGTSQLGAVSLPAAPPTAAGQPAVSAPVGAGS
jgi:rare lipoprotein A